MVDTEIVWLIQEAFGCYRTLLAATRRCWLVQGGTGCYSKLLVVPVRLFLGQSHSSQKVAGCYKSRRKSSFDLSVGPGV